MGRTPAKIERGVRCCASANIDKCTGCPYAGLHVGIGCKTILFRDVQDYLKEIKISAARIEDMTKQLESAQPKWISVEERLPGEFVDVLLYGDSRGIAIGSYDANDGYFWKREDENTLRSVNATHWMPLPSCPEEE